MQTFYYTLINMLDLSKSNHILEVPCGTGRLLSLALSLKNKQSTYLACDLSPEMIQLCLSNLQKYKEKMEVE